MQNCPISPLDLTRSLLDEIEAHTGSKQIASVPGEFTRWTKAVKDWLDQKGAQLGFRSFYVGNGGEFLLDFLWWKEGPGGGAVLACESEWGNTRDSRRNPGRVAEDFAKLLSFKAPLKLMIFSSDGDPRIQAETIAELNRYLSEFDDHRVGEHYIVVDITRPQDAAWLCKIKEEGYSPNVRLEQLMVGPG